MNKSLCFITTGDVANIATAKRAFGLANPLSDLGWKVHILLEDCDENRHRGALECDDRTSLHFFAPSSMMQERRQKEAIIREINPSHLYLCAFVARNIVGIGHRSTKLVEHAELQSRIPDLKGLKRIFCFISEYYSILYADALLNASQYLQKVYRRRSRYLLHGSMPMLYFPYAFNPEVLRLTKIDYSQPQFSRFADKFNFVFIGSVVKGYGIFTILEAVNRLKTKTSDFNMLILGRGNDYEAAQEFIKQNHLSDFVYMPGYIAEEEVSTFFSIADAFVSPMNDTIQDWARCPSKIYLYLPYRRPIITCRIGEPYETLKDDGYYYETGNSESLAEQMLATVQAGKGETTINPNLHSWTARATQLAEFINQEL